jgi:hypothetical protein
LAHAAHNGQSFADHTNHGEHPLRKNQNTAAKRQREMAKKIKAEAKRARREKLKKDAAQAEELPPAQMEQEDTDDPASPAESS